MWQAGSNPAQPSGREKMREGRRGETMKIIMIIETLEHPNPTVLNTVKDIVYKCESELKEYALVKDTDVTFAP